MANYRTACGNSAIPVLEPVRSHNLAGNVPMVLVCSFDGRSDVDVCVLIGRFIGFEFLTTHLRLQRSQFWLRIEMKHISSTGK
ncbi:hypothetical protein HanRHA438_Chr07g0307481 [Helianthus annuus]|nr:hypothetical protein HanHA300_Chr07g0244451 [Helianthus annuus]KAJ0557056.1 hypothetical protein HanIR_Chr07g0320801 [Helianthus annuus]KAJ0563311.1 hypothetical protein HanHA89_Chr07g0261651 [Helianthus annuus]KAJ0728658.1 hypothetical protein HanLR1_Chr07g0244121 [Helianthus annuus]KAJ0731410.1 hypothetical protein HanOQP8_Chr07g0251621 [Helianthus annuus]